MEKTMITSMAWVAKGFAKPMPNEYDIKLQDVEEMKNDPMIQEEFPPPKSSLSLKKAIFL